RVRRARVRRRGGERVHTASVWVRRPATSRRALATGGVALVVLAGAVILLLTYRGAPALTARDSLVLADFVNTTGESVFDGTLRQALAVQLEQSPYLHVIGDQRLRAVLQS